jgi:hypothetical protein
VSVSQGAAEDYRFRKRRPTIIDAQPAHRQVASEGQCPDGADSYDVRQLFRKCPDLDLTFIVSVLLQDSTPVCTVVKNVPKSSSGKIQQSPQIILRSLAGSTMRAHLI